MDSFKARHGRHGMLILFHSSHRESCLWFIQKIEIITEIDHVSASTDALDDGREQVKAQLFAVGKDERDRDDMQVLEVSQRGLSLFNGPILMICFEFAGGHTPSNSP